jgi:hypothetical protein
VYRRGVLAYFRRLRDKYRLWRLHSKLFREQGFVCYCPDCRTVLNDQEATHERDAFYSYVCPACGKRATFGLDFMAPLYIKDFI